MSYPPVAPGALPAADRYGALVLTDVRGVALGRRCRAVELLLQHGADVHITNDAGRDALGEARLMGRWPEILDLLEAAAGRRRAPLPDTDRRARA